MGYQATPDGGGAAVLDVGGTVVDTFPEKLYLLERTWLDIDHGDFPLPEDVCRSILPMANGTGEMFSFAAAYRERQDIGDREEVMRWYSGIAERGGHAYLENRSRLMKTEDRWLEKNPLFPGVKEMFAGLDSMPVYVCFASDKPAGEVRRILGANGLSAHEILEPGEKGKMGQYAEVVKRGFEPGGIVVYDDMARNLAAANENGMNVIAAPQGYDRPGSIAPYEKAYPAQFPAALSSILFGSCEEKAEAADIILRPVSAPAYTRNHV